MIERLKCFSDFVKLWSLGFFYRYVVPVKTMPFSALEVMQCILEMNQLEHVMSVTKSVVIKFNVRLYYLPQDQWSSAGSLAQRSAESPSHPIDLFVEARRLLRAFLFCRSYSIMPSQVHARTQTLAINAVAQLDNIFAYIASHLAATASVVTPDGHAGEGSPHRGLHRRCSCCHSSSSPALCSISISDGARRRGRIIQSSGGAQHRSDSCSRDPEAMSSMRLHADSHLFPLLPSTSASLDAAADSLGGRHVSDGSSR